MAEDLNIHDDLVSIAKKDMSEWAQDVVYEAMRNLGATRKRASFRASYNKRGVPQGSPVIKYRMRKSDSTGALRKSLNYEIDDNLNVRFTSLFYGKWVDLGRQGRRKKWRGAVKSGKGIPLSPLKVWTQKKPIRPRSLDTGQFIPKTKENIAAMLFMINRKIRWYGIQPTHFYQDAIKEGLNKIQ